VVIERFPSSLRSTRNLWALSLTVAREHHEADHERQRCFLVGEVSHAHRTSIAEDRPRGNGSWLSAGENHTVGQNGSYLDRTQDAVAVGDSRRDAIEYSL